jgi:hypothetical protein
MFDKNNIDYLVSQFSSYLIAATDPDKRSLVSVSKAEFIAALRECETDLEFLQKRRRLQDGVSEGKVAGVLLFRLCQRRNVHLHLQGLKEDPPEAHTLQERAAIHTVLQLLNLDISQDHLSSSVGTHRSPNIPAKALQDLETELLYLVKRRHCNQENLGIFFDAACYLDAGIARLKAIGSPTC